MQKVVIAAYHPLLLKGIIKTLSENNGDCKIIGHSSSAKGLVKLVQKYNPDAAIIDVAVTWSCGMDILEEIKKITTTIELHFICSHPIDKSVCSYLEGRTTRNKYQYIKRDTFIPEL